MRRKEDQHSCGIYLVNMVRWWGIHPPETLLTSLTGVRSYLDDTIIDKAKRIAKEMGVYPFGLIHVSFKQEHTLLYTHKT